MQRREILRRGMAAALGATLPWAVSARSGVPAPDDGTQTPPLDTRDAYVAWMVYHRGEDPAFLAQRYDRYLELIKHHDVWDERNKRAYLMTPRERFVTERNLKRAYEWHYLDIGYGVTITGPHTVARMTNVIDPKRGEKVLEIGNGSGYQSAYLSYLTDQVYSIEIIEPLFERTGRLYETLIGEGYKEYAAIQRKRGDGYYGWEEHAPFDKMIVTCGIDHVPPPLLQQLKTGGTMVIPIGPPGAQHVLEVVKHEKADGSVAVTRSDIYHGAIINFVPFTKGKAG